MLGATTYPRTSPSDEVMRAVADEMGVGHTFRPAEVGVFFGARAGGGGARPLLRRRGPRASRVPALRGVHDRLPPQRQEHGGQELPPPRRGRRRAHPPDDDGPHRPARGRRPVRGRRATRSRCVAPGVPARAADVHGRPGRRVRLGARHPAPAAPHAPSRRPPARLGAPRDAVAHQLRGHPLGAHPVGGRRLHPRGLDHLVDPPRRAHPRRTRALRPRVEPARAALGGARRRHRRAQRPLARRARAVVAPGARRGGDPSPDPAHAAPPAALGRAVDRAAGDAVAGQLADAAPAPLLPGAHVAPGRRHAEPRVDPGGPRRRPPRRPAHRRRPGGRELEPGQRPGHRPLPRGRGDRRDAGDRRRRPVPPPARPPRRARRRRLDRAGEPRGEPVADHHRAGRAGDVAVAQPRRARSAPRARASPTGASTPSPRTIPPSRPTPPGALVRDIRAYSPQDHARGGVR